MQPTKATTMAIAAKVVQLQDETLQLGVRMAARPWECGVTGSLVV